MDGYVPVTMIKTLAELSGVFVDSRTTEPVAFAVQAFALFVDEVEAERTTTVPLSAEMGPVKSAIRLTPDAMPVGNVFEVDRLGAIMITFKFGFGVVDVSA